MIHIAKLDRQERVDLFLITSAQMLVPPSIIEKDFWVCYILDYLFNRSIFSHKLIFKGGTSLSKCYNLINRFSEDIDLILDWRELGYTIHEPWNNRSNAQQDRFKTDSIKRTNDYLEKVFIPMIHQDIAEELGFDINIRLADEEETVIIEYPKQFELSAILDVVRLEIGPLAAFTPAQSVEVQPYLAQKQPKLFEHPGFMVQAVKPERTFWEKATILHQEANRPAEKAMLPRYSRHYYDLYRLANSSVKEKALIEIDMLRKVIAFKEKFYRTPWSKLPQAIPGSLRLIPPSFRMKELQKDHTAMQQMLIGAALQLDDILNDLASLEKEINALT